MSDKPWDWFDTSTRDGLHRVAEESVARGISQKQEHGESSDSWAIRQAAEAAIRANQN